MSEDVVTRKLADLEEIDEKIIENKPWAQQLMSTMLQVTKKAVLNWSNIILTIGEQDLDIDEYVTIFKHQVETIYEELITDVDILQEKRYDKIGQLLQQLQNLCCDLHLEMPTFTFEDTPLCDVYSNVQSKVEKYEALAEIRRKEVQELNEKQLKLCKNLGRKPNLLQESPLPLPNELDVVRIHIDALENVAIEREERFFQMKEEITQIVAQLGIPPSLDFEKDILNMTNTEVMISDSDMEQLQLYHDRMVSQLRSVEEEIKELREKIDSLWDKLETDIAERDAVRGNTTGNSLKTLETLKKEIAKLEEKKRANIHIFIQKQREELVELWQRCHCTETDKQAFSFFNSEYYNEDLLDLHDIEIRKWKTYYNNHKEMFARLEEYKNLWDDHLKLERKSGGTNRYKNRGGQLLAEEKLRNRFRKRIPKCEEALQKLAEAYFIRKGEHFRTFGLTVEEYIAKLHADAQMDFQLRLSAKKQQREQTTTGVSCRTNLFSPSPAARSCTKRKLILTPSTAPSKKLKPLSLKRAPNTGLPKLNVSRNRRRSGKNIRHRLSFTSSKSSNKENGHDSGSTSYDDFEQDMITRGNARSTHFPLPETPQLLTVPQNF